MRSRLLAITTLFAMGLCILLAAPAQRRKKVDSRQPSDSRVHLLHSDRLYFDDRINRDAQFLVGNVQFEHDGTLMYCDSALFYEATNSFDAFGHVLMKQGDTLDLVGEELYYNGIDQLARVRYNVVLTHRDTKLFTDSLDYDRLYDLGYFFEGGKLLDGDNELTSDWGEYSPTTRNAIFNYNVRLQTPPMPEPPRTVLLSDTLYYNTLQKIAHVVGPSNIEHGGNHIYTELGYYNTTTDFSYLLQRSILQNGEKRLIGDSVVWDNQMHEGEAFGNAVYTDIGNKNMMTGEYCYYNDSTGYAEATDSAVLIDFSQKDTMWAHADTFKLFTHNINTDSVFRTLHGYRHFRAYRRDIQAVCDSMAYVSKDSCMTMYYDPILWMNEQQVLGEEIKAFFNDSTIDSVHIVRQALSVERMDSIHYNQIAGKMMYFYFLNGDIDHSVVEGNVMVNYYPLDDDSLMIGMNHTESTLMKIFMKERKVDHIWMPAATGTLYPIPLIPSKDLYLENFTWFDYVRPLDKMDIFNWRPKKAGTELKAIVRRKAPQQKLEDIKASDPPK
ncbi:MAG: hypothetical protein HUK03_00555 [Bacteroidaceae bacterium]|nr:hypothetical protein [Bacteroidaceae bacterium]